MDSNKKSSIKKKLISFGIVVLIIAIVFLVGTMKNKQNAKEMYGTTADSDNVQTEITVRTPNADEFSNTLVAESENYELYLDGPTLSITLKNKTTGKVLESAIKEDDGKSNKQWSGFIKSGIVLNIIDGKNDQVQADLVNNAHEITIEEVENGFLAYVTFVDFGFSFEMTVTLVDDELIVEIPDNKVIESIEKYRIGAINVFPFLGYTYLGEQDGYMLIPDGNGALIYLNDKEGRLSGGFSRMIYGEDAGFKDAETVSLLWDQLQTVNESENLLAPIFGMVHTEDQIGFLGIIEEGAQRASIEAYPNGVTIDYNRIYPKFLLRKVYKQPTSESSSGTTEMIEKDRSHNDIKIRYCLVSGSDANYTGLAIKYRNYLLDSGEIAVKDNSYNTRLEFLGVEKEEWLIFKKDVVMTTVSDIRDILADLKAEGITEVLSVYKGWQNGGLYQVPITNYKA
ncbi:MAG: DUF5696 domain-containing protein, partial [Mobilitalea sp.]